MVLRESSQPMPDISCTATSRRSSRSCLSIVLAVFALALPVAAGGQQAVPVLMGAMTTELHRAFTSLGKQGDTKQLPPYFLSYSVSDASFVAIRAQYGALVDSSANHIRVADVQVRVGSPKLDNAHGMHRSSAVTSTELPLTD